MAQSIKRLDLNSTENFTVDHDLSFIDNNSKCSRYITESETSIFFGDACRALNILHINCRSLKHNFNNIKNLLNIVSQRLTALAVTETWLSSYNADMYNLPGYNFVSNCRCDKPGGGVGIYVNDCLEYTIRHELCKMTPYIESVFIEISRSNQQNVIVGCIYRPPNTDPNLFNVDVLTMLRLFGNEKNRLMLIAGDFNLDLLRYDSHAPTSDFLHNMMSYSLFPSIRSPTRITDQSATLIDNIFINFTNGDFDSAVIYNDISDHLPIGLLLNEKCTRNKKINSVKVRVFTQEPTNNFLGHLSSTSWDEVYNILQFS